MAFIFNFSDDRIRQLEREDRINDKLLEGCKECPKLLVEYFHLQRKKNKQQTEKVDKAGIFDKYSVIKGNMKEIDKHLDNMERGLSGKEYNKCERLRYILYGPTLDDLYDEHLDMLMMEELENNLIKDDN